MEKTQMQEKKITQFLAVLLAVCIAISGLWVPPYEVSGATSALTAAQNKKKQLEQQLEEAQQKLKEYQSQMENAASEAERLEAELAVQQAEKEALTAELLTLYAEGEAIMAALADAEAAYAEAEANFKEKSRIMYVYSTQSPLEILADSDSIADFFKRIQLILYLAEEDNKLLEELEMTKLDYEYKKQYQEENQALINEMIAQKDLTIDNITLTKEELENKIATAKELLSAEYEKEANLEEDLDAVKSEIKNLQSTPRPTKTPKPSSTKKPSNNSTGGSNQYTGGELLWPVPVYKRISSEYGYRSDPFTGKKTMHTGIDISAAKGSSILAVEDGTVIMATTNGGYGLCIKVDHGGGLVTLYAHCDEMLVKKGDKVKKGDLIARVGTTGRSTGNHLHFEVRVNNQHTDPMPYFQG